MEDKIQELVNEIKSQAPADCTAIDIFLNAYSFEVKYTRRTAEQLKEDYISMKNVNGEWIT